MISVSRASCSVRFMRDMQSITFTDRFNSTPNSILTLNHSTDLFQFSIFLLEYASVEIFHFDVHFGEVETASTYTTVGAATKAEARNRDTLREERNEQMFSDLITTFQNSQNNFKKETTRTSGMLGTKSQFCWLKLTSVVRCLHLSVPAKMFRGWYTPEGKFFCGHWSMSTRRKSISIPDVPLLRRISSNPAKRWKCRR